MCKTMLLLIKNKKTKLFLLMSPLRSVASLRNDPARFQRVKHFFVLPPCVDMFLLFILIDVYLSFSSSGPSPFPCQYDS